MDLNFETVGLNFNGKGKPELIATPKHICADMSNLFDYTDCNKKIWADIYCKTGNTLEAVIEHGVNKNNVVAICDNKQSQMLICRKLYGKLLPEIEVEITTESLEAFSITRRGQVYCVDDWTKIIKYNYRNAYNIIKYVVMKEMEKTMALEFTQEDNFQINNIIMNPPYNNDMYIDFVELAHKIASENVVAITPAKCINGKSDSKNDKFRTEITPYIKKAVFYPETTDIFDIREASGICYYLISKDKQHTKYVKVHCTKSDVIATDFEIHDETQLKLTNRQILSIIGKVGTLGEGFKQSLYVKNTDRGEETIANTLGEGFKQSLYVKNTDRGEETIANTLGFKRQTYVYEQDRGEEVKQLDYVEVMQGEKVVGYKRKDELYTTDKLDKYKVTTSIMAGNIYLDDDGKTLGIVPCNIIGPNQVPKGSYPVLKYFNTKEEAKSFKSYYESKLVSFLFYFGACGTTLTKEFYKYIPDPVNFDHIFTDDELYKKYNLTKEEIEIIESIIKERK